MTYTSSSSGLQLEAANFAGGMIKVTGTNQEINYFLTDHLGSVRVIVDGSGTVKERNDYYAFGAKHVRSDYSQNTNRYDYNGKEEQTTGDLKYLDYGARMYDAALGRWFNVDRLAGDYYPYSSYSYTTGNPSLFIDVNGDYISFYELARYMGRLPNYSYSVSAPDIDAGGWSISRYFTEAGELVGYGASRDGQFYVMDDVGDLDIFLSQLSLFSAAADMFYINGEPSEGMLALMAGDTWKGLGMLWKDALTDPGYYMYLANAVGAAAMMLPSAARQPMNPNAYHVTPHGVVLPKGNIIPANLVANPSGRVGSYGHMVNGEFMEVIRIDAATPPGYKGPNQSHYHSNGSRKHRTTNWPYKN